MIEFKPFSKIARLNRDITITEKIDGTNGAIGVVEIEPYEAMTIREAMPVFRVPAPTGTFVVYAQSRSKVITPESDNHGFACWVWGNAEALVNVLGPGLHFGEWWGNGINRGYGLPIGEKRFSLFNTSRWGPANEHGIQAQVDDGIGFVPGLGVVPVLYEGPFDRQDHKPYPWKQALHELQKNGSYAAPGFYRPEGIVIYHHAANMMFKATLEHDEEPKEVVRRRQALAA